MRTTFVHCSRCGKEGHNKRGCGRRAAMRRQLRRWRRESERRRKERRRAAGECWKCGAAAAPFKRCLECRLSQSTTKAKCRAGKAPSP
jgi:hypothetical protein